jgi:hypothetical protein
VTIKDAASTTSMPKVEWLGVGVDNIHNARTVRGAGYRLSVQATKKLRFSSNGGTLAGPYEVWGE